MQRITLSVITSSFALYSSIERDQCSWNLRTLTATYLSCNALYVSTYVFFCPTMPMHLSIRNELSWRFNSLTCVSSPAINKSDFSAWKLTVNICRAYARPPCDTLDGQLIRSTCNSYVLSRLVGPSCFCNQQAELWSGFVHSPTQKSLLSNSLPLSNCSVSVKKIGVECKHSLTFTLQTLVQKF